MKAAYKNANNLHLDRHSDRRTDRRTDGQTDRQIEEQSDRRTDRGTLGLTDKQKKSAELSSNLSSPKYTVARLVSLTAIKAFHRYWQPEQEGFEDSKER